MIGGFSCLGAVARFFSFFLLATAMILITIMNGQRIRHSKGGVMKENKLTRLYSDFEIRPCRLGAAHGLTLQKVRNYVRVGGRETQTPVYHREEEEEK